MSQTLRDVLFSGAADHDYEPSCGELQKSVADHVFRERFFFFQIADD